LDSHIPDEIAGWRLAGVARNKIDYWNQHFQNERDAGRFDTDICPCLGLSDSSRLIHGGFHVAGLSRRAVAEDFELLFAGSPKVDSRQPQPDCGYRQNYGEGSDNSLVVVVALDPIKPAFKAEKGSSKEGGAIMMFIVVGGLLTVFWFYQARP
jgi:hypothetical protein